jgi:hypothetical protein
MLGSAGGPLGLARWGGFLSEEEAQSYAENI